MKTKLTLLSFSCVCLFACTKEINTNLPAAVLVSSALDNDNALLGNPTNAMADINFADNYYKDNGYYKLSYDSKKGIPVWVSWHLQSSDLDTVTRQNNFSADYSLPSNWNRVTTTAYTNSGFDRGHNCPSADRTGSLQANAATFLMSNIIPQAPMLNQGPWEGLENFIRVSLVGERNEAYLLMGNFGAGGSGSAGTAVSINNGTIAVPKTIWKIALVIKKGNNDLERIDTAATVLAIKMPNQNALYSNTSMGKTAWKNYITNIKLIEEDAAAEGISIDLLHNIGEPVKTYLKKKIYR